MKRKAIYIAIIGLCLIAFLIPYLPGQVWISHSIDGAGGSGFGRSGKGTDFSTATWKSLNNARVEAINVHYASAQDARMDFDEEMKEAGMRVDGQASARCERIVRAANERGDSQGAITIVHLLDRDINYIHAGNLRTALTFEGAWIKW